MKNLLLLSLLLSQPIFAWNFIEKSIDVGLSYEHNYDSTVIIKEEQIIAGGLAIGDVNGDGWDDIFAITGENLNSNGANNNPNKLFVSQKNGLYLEMSLEFGLNTEDVSNAGPLIADINGDGFRDLLIGSVSNSPLITTYVNDENGSFIKIDNSFYPSKTFSISAADTDKDGDLDLFLSHWLNDTEHNYWSNDGFGAFTDITTTHLDTSPISNSFTAIFADVNNDNSDDLLLTNDFGSSQYFINDSSGMMNHQITNTIDDENGMGAAVGDYDNDGDLDWFASSIYDPDGISEGNWGVTGNRLYRNNGNGNFTEVSEFAGVRQGYWGWGSCFADFNNDMYLDIFHVNGFPSDVVDEDEFVNDASRLYINNQDGTFTEMSSQLGLVDTKMGRAIICFDSDRDGDIDILINNNQSYSSFYENQLGSDYHYLAVKLLQSDSNIDAIGAKISLTVNGVTQFRQVLAGGSFASSNPTTQHFGLGENSLVDSLVVTWPDGEIQTFVNLATNRLMTINKGQGTHSTPRAVPISLFSVLMLALIILLSFYFFQKTNAKRS